MSLLAESVSEIVDFAMLGPACGLWARRHLRLGTRKNVDLCQKLPLKKAQVGFKAKKSQVKQALLMWELYYLPDNTRQSLTFASRCLPLHTVGHFNRGAQLALNSMVQAQFI